MIDTKAAMQQAIDSLIESARLLGAIQDKKLYGTYTQIDSMFEATCYEIIEAKRQTILDAFAQPEQKPNAWRVTGTNRLYDHHDAEQEAKRCGGSSCAYPIYTEPQPPMPVNNHTLLLAEAYQVVGSLLSDMGQFDTDKGQKVLDNLSQGQMVHNDVLPWPSFAKKETEFSIADLALEHFGEYSAKYYNFATALLNLKTK